MKILKSLNPDLKLTRPALEASLPKYSAIQKLNFVLPILGNIFPRTDAINRVSPDNLNQIKIFTAQYVSYRLSNPLNPALSTYLSRDAINRVSTPAPVSAPSTTPAPVSATATATATATAPSAAPSAATAAVPPATSSIIQPVFYSIPLLLIHHTKITRKILIESLSALSTDEKLNLILALFDSIAQNESQLNELNTIISGYVRFCLRSLKKSVKRAVMVNK